jgi:hypothetical protein
MPAMDSSPPKCLRTGRCCLGADVTFFLFAMTPGEVARMVEAPDTCGGQGMSIKDGTYTHVDRNRCVSCSSGHASVTGGRNDSRGE